MVKNVFKIRPLALADGTVDLKPVSSENSNPELARSETGLKPDSVDPNGAVASLKRSSLLIPLVKATLKKRVGLYFTNSV